MKIRSVTSGFNCTGVNKSNLEKKIRQFFKESNALFLKKNIKVRTNRLNLPPFRVKESLENENINSVIEWVSKFCYENEIRWFCVPFYTFKQNMEEINSIAIETAKRYKNAFINFIIAKEYKINREAILYVSKFIKSISRLSNNGYDNFRIGASFNCDPNAPFFPFTYHYGENGFSIALELVPFFIRVIENNKTKDIEIIREELLKTIAPLLIDINDLSMEIEKNTGIHYYGMDISLAPYPDNERNSVAKIVELLGADSFGCYGTVFFTSYLTDVLKALITKSKIKSIGFNGVMFSLLEDTRLGIKNSSKEFSIDSLLSYSSVCGCGIDMVPIPGEAFEEEIASLMLDIASISSLLKKPLGVRILPIPLKHENEFTEFNYDFLNNTRIKNIKNKACFNKIFKNKELFSYLDFS